MHLLPPFSPEYNYFFLFTVVSRSVVSRKRQSSSVEHRVIPPRTLFPTQFYNNPFLHFFFLFLFLLSSTTTIIVHTYVPGLISPFPSFFFFFPPPPPFVKMLNVSWTVEYFRQTFSGEFRGNTNAFEAADLCAETFFPHVWAGLRSTLPSQTTRRLPSALYHVCRSTFLTYCELLVSSIC